MITLLENRATLLEPSTNPSGKTKEALRTRSIPSPRRRQIDPSVPQEVNALLSADLGVKTTKEIPTP